MSKQLLRVVTRETIDERKSQASLFLANASFFANNRSDT